MQSNLHKMALPRIYRCSGLQTCICITWLLTCLTYTNAFEESLLLEGFSAEPPTDPGAQRVIIAYHTEGCKVPLTVGAEGYSYEGAGAEYSERAPRGIQKVSLQSEDARNVAMSELQTRVRRRMLEKLGIRGAEFSGGEDTKLKSRYLSSIQFEVTEVPAGLSENDMIELGSDLPCVQYVEKDGFKVADSYERVIDLSDVTDRNLLHKPNDLYYDKQWALHEKSPFGVGAESTWSEWKGSESLIVAVIDSGCDLNHPDLQGQLWVNMGEENCENGIDDDGNGYIDDCFGYDWVDNDNNPSPRGSGHGTGAAGIISAKGDNGIGITGLCWNCKLMCLRFISGVEGKISNQVAAIDYAVKNGARISNNSYGGYGFSSLEYEAIRRAETAGHLFVASAGNNNLDTDLDQNPHTPSVYALSNILCAGASTPEGKKADFSNFGVRTVDVFAPGTNIQTIEEGGRYALVSGTSFAAPIATGAAALVWSKYPQLSNVLVRKCIIESCHRSGALEYESFCGGVINIRKALDIAKHYASTLKDFDVAAIGDEDFVDSLPPMHQHTEPHYNSHSSVPHFNRLVGSHSSHASAHVPPSHHSSSLRLSPLDGLFGGIGKLFRGPAQVEIDSDIPTHGKEHRLDLLDGHLLESNNLLERAIPMQLIEGQSHSHSHNDNSTRRLILNAPKHMVHSVSTNFMDEGHSKLNVDDAFKTLEGVVNRLPLQDKPKHLGSQRNSLKMRVHPQTVDEEPHAVSNAMHTLDGVVQNIHLKQKNEKLHNGLSGAVSNIQRTPLNNISVGSGILNAPLNSRKSDYNMQTIENKMTGWPSGVQQPTIKRIDDPTQI